MSLLGLSLVLAAAFCHATWNFFVKRVGGGPELVWLFSFVTVVLYLPAALFVLITDRPAFTPDQIIAIAGSVLLHLGYFLLLQRGYRSGDLSLVYPTARATGPLLATGFAILFLGETPGTQALIGGLLVIGGVLFLTGGAKSANATSGGTRPLASLGFGLSAGVLIASYTVWDARAVSLVAVPPLLLDYASSLGRSLLLAPIAARRAGLVRQQWRDHRGAILVIALFNPLAYILVLVALTFTPVTLVAPTRETSVLLTVLAGTVLLGEGSLKARLPWAAVILAGVSLLATA